ncbi:hypothetical protein CSKR_202102 [Clonorchis sinensis]|uniref:Uncharacterized protein n=1 Tax=Clonorchis sinensis TaxID=79923 RepID=A0A419Q590_CLOSI|nr:hypothetical protein CSKR_202102 [Clonorchis sinensis]
MYYNINKSFSCSTLSVPSCHATRRKHEGWDTARLPKPRQEESRGRGRVRTFRWLLICSTSLASGLQTFRHHTRRHHQCASWVSTSSLPACVYIAFEDHLLSSDLIGYLGLNYSRESIDPFVIFVALWSAFLCVDWLFQDLLFLVVRSLALIGIALWSDILRECQTNVKR